MISGGWIGAALLAICGLPQAYISYKTKSAKGISWIFLLLWGSGEVLTFLYVLPRQDVLPLVWNYGLNIVFISVILFFKIKEWIHENR